MELNKLQKLVLKEFAKLNLAQDFYWTGGTALAFFWLKHRESLDIDFFSNKPVNYAKITNFIRRLSKKTKLKKIVERKIFDRWEFYLTNSDKLRLEFVHYDFKPLKKRKLWQGIQIDSIEDMAANKTMALIERHEPKDAFDIYYLINKQKFTPEKLLSLAKKKFGLDISVSTFWSEAVWASKELTKIKVLLFGNAKNNTKQIQKIQRFFADSSNNFLSKQLNNH